MYPAPLNNCLPELRTLYDYWRSKRQGRRFPARADIEPLEIPRLLEHIGLIDVTPGGEDFSYRLIGTGVVRAFGEDPTGRVVGISTGGSYASVIREACHRCWETAQPVLFRGIYRTREDNNLWAERLLLPLGVAAQPNMLLFCLVLRQPETAYRLESTRIDLLAETPE